MNIKQKEISELNAIIDITVDKNDYSEPLNNSLREIKRKVAFKGFRQGMVPFELVKKIYGKGAMLEEINKVVSKSINEHFKNNNINILGEPLLISNNLDDKISEPEPEFSFSFEIGIAPNLEINFDKSLIIGKYEILSDEEDIEEKIKYYRKTYSNAVIADESSNDSYLFGNVQQVCGPEEEPFKAENIFIQLSELKNEASKELLTGKKVNEIIRFDVKEVLNDEKHISDFLKIKDVNSLTSTIFDFAVTKVYNIVEAENDKELWDNVLGKDVAGSPEEFNLKVEEELKNICSKESNYDVRNKIIDRLKGYADFVVPDDFLRKWLKSLRDDEIAEADFEQYYNRFQNDLRWKLVTEYLQKKFDIKVSEQEIQQAADIYARLQILRYNRNLLTDSYIEKVRNEILNDQDRMNYLKESIIVDKIVENVKELITLESKEIKYRDFLKINNENYGKQQ